MSAYSLVEALWRMWLQLFDGINLPWGQSATAAFGLVATLYIIGFAIKHVVGKQE